MLVGMKDIARLLFSFELDLRLHREEGKTLRIRISKLKNQRVGIDRGYIDSRRSTGLHPVCPNPETLELLGQTIRRIFSDSSSCQLLAPDEKLASEKGSGRQNKRLRIKNSPGFGTYAADF